MTDPLVPLPEPAHGASTPTATPAVDQDRVRASQEVKRRLGTEFSAQRAWLTPQDAHRSLRAARKALRTFQRTTGLPIDRIDSIGGHWGQHPVLAWAAANHYPLIAAWLLEGGCLPGEWCRPASVPPAVTASNPSAGAPALLRTPSPRVLSPDGEKTLATWWFQWGQDHPLLGNSIGRAVCAWVRRGDQPSPRGIGWTETVNETRVRPPEAREPAPVTLRAAITLSQRGRRVMPVLEAMRRNGWNFAQAERLPDPRGRTARITSARAWLSLGDRSPLSPSVLDAWRVWWQEQDRRALESAMTSAPSTPSGDEPASRPSERTRPRL